MQRIATLLGALALVTAAGAGTAAAQPTPPTRFFGAATAPDGATVTAFVGTNNCGTGTVTGGKYVVDVASASTKAGCGTDGATVSFQVGSVRASQTGTFQTGAFMPLDLTAGTAQATATPTARPATTPTARPATPPARPTTAPTARPTTAPAARTATAQAGTAQRPSAAPQAPAVAPRLPSTGAGTLADSGSVWLLGGLALAFVLAGGAGIAASRRR